MYLHHIGSMSYVTLSSFCQLDETVFHLQEVKVKQSWLLYAHFYPPAIEDPASVFQYLFQFSDKETMFVFHKCKSFHTLP